MPPHLVPHRSGVHRAACFALYRALLRQKNRLPLDERQRAILNSTIKATFERNANFDSPLRIIAALRLGYETLTILEPFKAQPDKLRQTLNRIATPAAGAPFPSLETAHIDDAQASSKTPPRPSKAPKAPPRVWPHPDNKSVLNRPFLNLTGNRHVPSLECANQVPFLRIKKPQSPFLSRIIRDEITTREKRTLRMQDLRLQTGVGKGEDRWDQLLEVICGVQQYNDKVSWGEEAEKALKHVSEVHQRRKDRASEMAEKMQEIVEKEQMLADEEKARRRDDKHAIKKRRRIARKQADMSSPAVT